MIPWRSNLFARHLIVLGLIVGFGCTSAPSQEGIKPQDAYQATTATLRTDPLNLPKTPLAAVARHDSAAAGVSTSATRQLSGGNPLWQIPVTSLSDTRERPIFSPSRRPPPIVNSPIEPSKPLAVAGPDRPPLSLVGAIVGENDGIAILLDQTTKVITRVKTGDSHAGWVLRSVKGREAMLEKDHQRAILALPNTPGE